MERIPAASKQIEVAGATVDFFTYVKDGITFYQFDTSRCGPPEPMVNAMAGLNLIDGAGKKLVMINHMSPGGLFDKIGDNFDYHVEKQDDGNVKVEFAYKAGASEAADLTQTSCSG